MSSTPWCGINTSDLNSVVSTSAAEIQRTLTNYPHAEVRWFASAEDGWRWIDGCQSPQGTATAARSRQYPDSPRSRRIRASAPYTVSGSPPPRSKRPPEREGFSHIPQELRSSSPGARFPSAFPPSSPAPASNYGDPDYELDIFDEELLDSYEHLVEDSFLGSRISLPPSSPINPGTQADEDDTNSTSSYDCDYPLDSVPLESELDYSDIPVSTPPTSQISSSQLATSFALRDFSPPKPSTPECHAAQSAIVDLPLDSCAPINTLSSESCSANTTPEHPNPTPPTELSDEQQDVLRRVLAGESLFFTGPAGTGKSVLLREIITKLEERNDYFAVTASTGIAALHIGGKTLHSFAGIGLGRQHISILIRKVRDNTYARHRWLYTNVLIVDEISMIDGDLFDTLEVIARSIRRNRDPFGGIQLVLCGDFFQLPPVDEQHPDIVSPKKLAKFAFESSSWRACVPTVITLTKVFRQKEPRLIQMLDEIRLGTVSSETLELVHNLSRRLIYEDGIQPTELFPRRLSVDLSNQRNLDMLPGRLITFKSRDSFYEDASGRKITPSRGREMLDRLAPDSIQFKVGAQVMCVKNLGGYAELANGSVGKVVDFMIPLDARNSRKDNHGTPRPDSFVSIIGNFEPSPDASPNPHGPNSVYEGTKWPVVEYLGGKRVLMGPSAFTIERISDGEVQVKRMQVPLILAWALTIHKSQGQTIERVKVDLQGTFEYGQAYVALSRCTSLDGLEVRNFFSRVVMADPKVLEWSEDPHSYISSSQPVPEYTRPAPRPSPLPMTACKSH